MKFKSGFTLLETILVLGIAVCVITIALLMSPNSLERYVFLGIYEENDYSLNNNNNDFKNFTTINKDMDDVF